MDVEEAIVNRRSVRAFNGKELPEGTAERLVELGNLAPSAGNLQARDFIIVRDKAMKEALAAAALDQDFMADAPVVIVITANLERIGHYGERGRELYCLQDVAAAVENILLAAQARGLGAVWVGAFDEGRVSGLLGLPGHARPVAMIPVGYPDQSPKARKRLPLKELVHYEKW